MLDPSTEYLETKRDGDIVTITLDRTEKLNALTPEIIYGLYDCFEALSEDPSYHVVITGNGDVTCAGMDTDIVGSDDYDSEYADADDRSREVSELISEYPYPTIMAGKGAVVGAAFGMSIACDFVILGEETHFSLPEITYGISTSAARLEQLADIVGTRVAKEIAMTGEPVPPELARELGLVNAVVPEDEVDEYAQDFVGQIAEYDSDIVQHIIDAV